mmetsp:Transcript_43091/g.130189  ORF Transcript_43091/g.130189 Transcript_43091/m.130189 type:complete len:83 (-) Transcript_43091:728-976(-)
MQWSKAISDAVNSVKLSEKEAKATASNQSNLPSAAMSKPCSKKEYAILATNGISKTNARWLLNLGKGLAPSPTLVWSLREAM